MMRANILLVHGGVHKGNCWDQLVPLLMAKGFTVSAIDLPGHGRQSTFYHDISLDSYATAVCSAAKAMGSPCVVIGHSFGGITISLAATREPDLFSRMIYLTALIPNSHYARGTSLTRDFVNPSRKGAMQLSLARGCIKPQAPLLTDYFYHDCPDTIARKASDFLCNQPLRPVLGRIRTDSGRFDHIPKHYIECTDDRVMPLAGQRKLQTHLTFESVASIESGHSPFVSMPAELADSIERLIS
jgi:pimeloyl-ACP methyl ester carboxylesterase